MIASTVPEKVKEMTAARYLSRAWPLLPSHAVRDAFSKKDVKVNGARVLPDAPVRGGDRVEVSRSAYTTKLVQLARRSFYQLINQKLGGLTP